MLQVKTREQLAQQDLETQKTLEAIHGPVRKELVIEALPCGQGIQTKWVTGSGEIVRQDYAVFATESFESKGEANI